MERFDCLIIGAGPCGIGAALKLKEAGINFALVDGSTPIMRQSNLSIEQYPF